MSSGNLFKSKFYAVNDDKKRVIDSNELIADKMQKLSEILEMESGGDFAEEFSMGLDAEQVEALLGEHEGGDDDFSGLTGNVIKEVPKVNTDELLEQARDEAGRIVDEAGAEAERIIENAKNEALNIRESARTEGSRDGYEEGLEKAQAEYARKEQELQDLELSLREEYDRRFETMEQDLVRELTSVYEHVLGITLADQSDIVINLMKDAIRNIEGGRNFLVHVSSADYAYVSAFREDIQNSVGGVDSIEIAEDVTLKASDCYIECESGIYECGLGTELSLLKKELRLLSYTGENDR